jgi:hypothetical protein
MTYDFLMKISEFDTEKVTKSIFDLLDTSAANLAKIEIMK